MRWNPEQYLSFADLRLRPAVELLARIPHESPKPVYDLGCGAGNVTRLLAERWPDATVSGVDGSAEMLAKAREAAPGLRFEQADLNRWRPDEPAEVLYSNAALHWLDDHAALFPRLLDLLSPGGVLAVQMPRNHAAPSHTMMEATVAEGPWAARLRPLLRPAPVAAPETYYDILAPLSSRLDLWETEYGQVLEGPDPVKEWTKGTALKPFLDALEGEQREAFERDYARRVAEAYPVRADGRTYFPFRRLFIVAVKA